MPHLTDTSTALRMSGMAAGIAVVGLAIGACGSDSSDAGTASTASPANSTADTGGGDYQNGSYSATGTYQSPGGKQSIGVTVDLADGVITTVDLDRSKTKGTSAEFQEKFASGIDKEVVGKKIDDLDVHKVSGSSLTSGGFNAAIEQIKSEAQA